MTEEVLLSLCQSGCMATLEEVNMTNVLNFDTDAACMHLATLVDKTSRLNTAATKV